mmetsp:Transcript_62261/g.158316  ORF Transcript_62261/g.158316 Transcript_62261/m.158316 type:complete len:223 (+) Transcript_62261:90-758(+)
MVAEQRVCPGAASWVRRRGVATVVLWLAVALQGPPEVEGMLAKMQAPLNSAFLQAADQDPTAQRMNMTSMKENLLPDGARHINRQTQTSDWLEEYANVKVVEPVAVNATEEATATPVVKPDAGNATTPVMEPDASNTTEEAAAAPVVEPDAGISTEKATATPVVEPDDGNAAEEAAATPAAAPDGAAPEVKGGLLSSVSGAALVGGSLMAASHLLSALYLFG